MENEVIEKEEINISESNTQSVSETAEQNAVAAIDNNTAKKAKIKKKLVKIIVLIVAVILSIAAVLGAVSLINYMKYAPYRNMLQSLCKEDFAYYKEYDETGLVYFYEYEDQNFVEKILNIKKNCYVKVTAEIYSLYDEEDVENNEALKDLICEENEKTYNEIPDICELVFDDSGAAKLMYQNETFFYINTDSNGEVVSVSYNENNGKTENSEAQKEFIKDSELREKYAAMLNEYVDYLSRNRKLSEIFTVAQYVSMANAVDIGVMGKDFVLDINDFVNRCFDNPEIEMEADRTNENLYFITVSGNCSYYTNRLFIKPYLTKWVKVVFRYDTEENNCRVVQDDDSAFGLYHSAKLHSY